MISENAITLQLIPPQEDPNLKEPQNPPAPLTTMKPETVMKSMALESPIQEIGFPTRTTGLENKNPAAPRK